MPSRRSVRCQAPSWDVRLGTLSPGMQGCILLYREAAGDQPATAVLGLAPVLSQGLLCSPLLRDFPRDGCVSPRRSGCGARRGFHPRCGAVPGSTSLGAR